jgi:transcriptional regulator with XRE-family HTH domain
MRIRISMASDFQTFFGQRVRALRLAAGRSQEELAAIANIDRATYGKLERGLINPSLLTLGRVAVALNLRLSDLVEGIALDPDQVRSLPRSTRGPSPIGGRRG